MSRRLAFLPSPIDPFCCLLWLDNFQKWRDKVDELHVYFNGDTEPQVADYIVNLYKKDPKIKVAYAPRMIQHGSALKQLTLDCHDNDSIMFIEDDAYVIDPMMVEKYFEVIEYGEHGLVGSPRTSSSMDIQKIASKRFNIDITGIGDKGIAFWPCFFFIKREHLLKTDLDFNAHQWMQGEYIKPLDWHVEAQNGVDIRGDTFVWGSIQLHRIMLDAGLKIMNIPQYHLHPYWESEMRERVNVFSPKATHMHVGSLSGGIYGHLVDDNGISLAFRKLNRQPLPAGWVLSSQANSEGEKLEHQKRIAFYELGVELHYNEAKTNFLDFTDQYVRALARVIVQWNLDEKDIKKQKEVYRKLLGL